MNPSVTAAPCQLPLAREPLGCSDEAPLAIVGVVWRSQTGGIPQAGRFPHRFVLSRSTSCESLSHGYAVPAPFSKGAFGVRCGGRGCGRLLIFQQMPPAKMQIESVLSHQKRVIHRQPIHTQQAPISPPCQRGVVLPLAKPGGFHRLAGFHIGPFFLEVPTVNPSVTAKATGGSPAVPPPFGKGAFKPPLPKGGGLAIAKPGG